MAKLTTATKEIKVSKTTSDFMDRYILGQFIKELKYIRRHESIATTNQNI